MIINKASKLALIKKKIQIEEQLTATSLLVYEMHCENKGKFRFFKCNIFMLACTARDSSELL